MSYLKRLLICILVPMILVFAGCRGQSTAGGGFAIDVVEKTGSVTSPGRLIPYVYVSGYYDKPIANKTASGTVVDYSGLEVDKSLGINCPVPGAYVSSNYYWVCYGETPAIWDHTFTLNYPCGFTNLVYSDNTDWTYTVKNVETLLTTGAEDYCLTSILPPASTRFAILGQLPQTLTLSGAAPFSTTYGMPKLYVYDGTQTQVATETATSVSSNGSQATFPFPSSLVQNGYSLAVVNQTAGTAGYTAVGTNFLSIAQSTTIAGNPFGVSVGAQTDAFEDCDPCLGGPKSNQCSTGSSHTTFPVVSLYSKNQVLVGGTAVSVGANPTAVATYPANAVTITATGSCEENKNTYSGNTRAIVANSGGNTVSILDIVKDVLLFNVTVGNQPVALAVSSDGSEAYVANHKDSTITRVNLSTRAATTVAVGGKPTSVSLTSAGTLWVGGVGFLTEINTSTMGVVATEAVAGKTIVALGYSNSIGQLVATTVDSSGNVYADEINPTSVTAGGTYTPLASNEVSSLGTHLDSQTHANVRSFTGTLASESIINTNQVGAPPLVVQDGWAVITATPTGFTITDITGHVVLVSEKTPSPVTAIAIDSKLNVAYLTMPDSNILLTVPLPGTN